MSHKKFGPDRFSRFDVYWIQTDRHTNRQTDKRNLHIEAYHICKYLEMSESQQCTLKTFILSVMEDIFVSLGFKLFNFGDSSQVFLY